MQEYFKYLNQYYDKIYILTLPRLTARIENCKKIFAGLNFEFFYGIDKLNTSLEELSLKNIYDLKDYQTIYKKPATMPLGMLCCSLGHVGIYESIIKNGYKKTLILEDDAFPIETSMQYFSQVMNELPANWELVYLGYEKNEQKGLKEKIKTIFYSLFPFHTKLNLNRKIYSNFYPEKISSHIAKAGFHDCTHAYAITLEAAKKLLQQQQPVKFHPDNLLSFMICSNLLNGYIVRPKFFNQLSAFTHQTESLTSD